MDHSFQVSAELKSRFWLLYLVLTCSSALYLFMRVWWYQETSLIQILRSLITVGAPLSYTFRLTVSVLPYLYSTLNLRDSGVQFGNRQFDWDSIVSASPSFWPLLFGGGIKLHLRTGDTVFISTFFQPFDQICQLINSKKDIPLLLNFGSESLYLKTVWDDLHWSLKKIPLLVVFVLPTTLLFFTQLALQWDSVLVLVGLSSLIWIASRSSMGTLESKLLPGASAHRSNTRRFVVLFSSIALYYALVWGFAKLFSLFSVD